MWLLEAASLSASALEWCDFSEEVQLNFAALKASGSLLVELRWFGRLLRVNLTLQFLRNKTQSQYLGVVTEVQQYVGEAVLGRGSGL